MLITRLRLKNWRNFREVDVCLGSRGYLLGANASGKSNLLDVFRFLRTLAQTEGGGLQKAIKERGGMAKLRSLHARRDSEVRIEVEMAESSASDLPTWRYALAFKSGTKGQQRVLITEEAVDYLGTKVFRRPDQDDMADIDRLTQTHLEQINNNARFRAVVDCFEATTYLHLVPQLLKHNSEIGARQLDYDPFGQGLLQRIAKTPKKTRDARIGRIEKALSQAVPLFSQLRFEQELISGLWHLEANFTHWRVNGAWQREDQFSDGTLRLIGLLWALQEGSGLLLLEEPELSLNDGIVKHIPLMIDRVLRLARMPFRQVLISTHSEVLMTQISDPQSVLLIEPGANGSTVRPPGADEVQALDNGLNAAEVLLPKTRVTTLDQLGLFS